MGLTKEKFMEFEDRIFLMSEEQLSRLDLLIYGERMSRDSGLDDFLCEAQADEVRIHQPACVNELVQF